MKNGPLTQCAGGLLFSDLANLADIARAFRVSEYSVELVPTLPSVRNVYGAKLHEQFSATTNGHNQRLSVMFVMAYSFR